MKLTKVGIIAAIALAAAACTQVPAGNVGVKVKNIGGDAGVQQTELTTGMHAVGFGEQVYIFPTTQKIYPFQHKVEEGVSPGGEQIQFTDVTGLQLNGDVAVTVRIDPSKASNIYDKYRKDVDQLIHTEVRMAVRSAIREQSRKYTSEQIYSAKEAQILTDALVSLQNRFHKEGIEVISLDWIGNIRYPQSVLDAITLKTTKLQEAEAAKADEQRAIAQANANIATARGEAEATRIRGEALRTNPQILQQMWIEKWKGEVPSTVTGENTMMMVTPR